MVRSELRSKLAKMVNLERVQARMQTWPDERERVQGANTRANFGSLLINSNIEF